MKDKIKFSIIIPTLNEEDNIKKIFEQLNNKNNLEIIVVDGGSRDRTRKIARRNKAKVYEVKGGRGRQLNFGVKKSRGTVLVFLHADTILPNNFLENIEVVLQNKKISGGAFRLKIDSKNFGLKFISFCANLRSVFLSMPYGDQTIFVRKKVFKEVGQFKEWPIMEDFELMKRLKKRKKKLKIISEYVITSARRWDRLGVFKTTWINKKIIWKYYMGVPANKLAELYRK